MTQSTRDLVDYYSNLLILQYVGRARAYATVQTQVQPVVMPQVSVETVSFSPAPTSGTFTLSYNGSDSPPINWDDSAATVQSKLRTIAPLVYTGGDSATSIFPLTLNGGVADTAAFSDTIDGGSAFGFSFGTITVTGSIATGLVVTFAGITPPAYLLTVADNGLLSSGQPVAITIAETDQTLPVAVENAYNLTGPATALGRQLDVLGKYVGVTRSGSGFTAPITLNDADFLALIKMAIVKNSAGSSLSVIVALLNQFFGTSIIVFDYKNMRMSFLVSSAVGSQDLIQLFITEGLLPVPMAVGFSVIVSPVITRFFGFRTYTSPATMAEPFNTYSSYDTTRPWLVYADGL